MFEACKSEQRTPLREETATWNPTTLSPSSHILPLLPAVLEIKQHNAALLSSLSFLTPSRAPDWPRHLNRFGRMSRFADTKPFQREAWAPKSKAQKGTEDTLQVPKYSQPHVQGLCWLSPSFSAISLGLGWSPGCLFWTLFGPPALCGTFGHATGRIACTSLRHTPPSQSLSLTLRPKRTHSFL